MTGPVMLQAVRPLNAPGGGRVEAGGLFVVDPELAMVLLSGGTAVRVEPLPAAPATADLPPVELEALVSVRGPDGELVDAGGRFACPRGLAEVMVAGGSSRLVGERPAGWAVAASLALSDQGAVIDAHPNVPRQPPAPQQPAAGPARLVAQVDLYSGDGDPIDCGGSWLEADPVYAAVLCEHGRARRAYL